MNPIAVMPKVDTTVSRSRYYWMSPIMKALSRALNTLLDDVQDPMLTFVNVE